MKRRLKNKKVDEKIEVFFCAIVLLIFIGVVLLDVFVVNSVLDLDKSISSAMRRNPVQVHKSPVAYYGGSSRVFIPAGDNLTAKITFRVTAPITTGYLDVLYNKSVFSTENCYLENEERIPLNTLTRKGTEYRLSFDMNNYVPVGEYLFVFRFFDSNNNLVYWTEMRVLAEE